MRGPITSVRIPFGLLGGRMVSPAEVVSGLACGCVCPGCGAALVARKGSIAWCFAHHAKTGSESCSESAIHAVGKQVKHCFSKISSLDVKASRKDSQLTTSLPGPVNGLA